MAFNRKQRLRDNIEAIRTVFALEREQMTATSEERAILQRYCGFGGLKCILNPARELTDAVHWAKSDLDLFAPTVELHGLIRENSKDDTEYKRYMDAMKQSVLTAFYTPPEITATIAGVLHEHGIRPDYVLEPSAGVGAFVDAVLENKPNEAIMAFEQDLMTGKILKHLHPDQKVRIQGFEKIEKPFMDHFDLAISNIPFGDIAVFDPDFSGSHDTARRLASKTIHNYFFLKSLDAVRDGGIVAFITSQGTLDSPGNSSIRAEMLVRADLISVVRLPNNLFTENANTEAGSDLIVLQKNSEKGEPTDDELRFISSRIDPFSGAHTNDYVSRYSSRIAFTDYKFDTDSYGKPAKVFTHSGGVKGIASDLYKFLSDDFSRRLDLRRFNEQKTGERQKSSQPASTKQTSERFKEEFKNTGSHPMRPVEEKSEAETHRPEYPEGVQLSLLDLWGMTGEVRRQKSSARKTEGKGSPARRMPPKTQVRSATVPSPATVKPGIEGRVEKPADEMRQGDPEDVYAALDWDDNPPVNGFYETMMTLTP
ncbi:MAG: SAM-dependent methyltransferase, partial [Odoribacter sp.]|nr:SAM-dependent methyltransferase [Odoribacter sp.]